MRRALVVAGLLVSALFAYVAVAGTNPREVWLALRESDFAWVAAALGVLAIGFLVRAARWRSLFEAGRRPPLRRVAGALFVGYLFNSILPLRAGEPARVVALNRLSGTSLAEAGATASLERVYDVLSLLVLLFVLLPWLPDLAWLHGAAVLAAVLAVVVGAAVAGVALFRDRPVAFAARQLARLPWVSEARLADSPANVLHGLAGLRDPATAAAATAWTVASWLVVGVGFWLVTVAFGLGLSPLAGLLVVIGVGLAMILPSPPAAVGVFEGAAVIVLRAYDVPESEALSCALVLHALTVVPFLVLALPMLRFGPSLRGGPRGLRQPAGETSLRT